MADTAQWVEIGRWAGAGGFGSLTYACAKWAVVWRREGRSDRAQDVDADERERRMAMEERARAATEVWSIVEDLRRTNADLQASKRDHETRISVLEGELRDCNNDNLRLRRLVVAGGGDPNGG